MPSIGETLQRERLRQGLQLEQVAKQTKIGLHLLEALEMDRFERLPGGTFAKSFVLQYARLLGLDEDEMRAALKQQFEEPATDAADAAAPVLPRHVPHVPPLDGFRERFHSDSSLTALFWVVATVLACAGAYNVWLKERRPDVLLEPVAAVHPTLKTPAAQPAKMETNKPSQHASATKPDFRAAELSEAGTITPAEPEPKHADISSSAMRVAITATEPVWVSVKADGTRSYTGVLDPQQSKQLEADKKMTVLMGNAGGLEIALNGKPVGPFGERGEIRLVVLTPDGAHVVPRTPPTPSLTPDDSGTAPTDERP